MSSLTSFRTELGQCYAGIILAAEEAPVMTPRRDLPVELSPPGHVRFLPATSLAIQSLVVRDLVHTNLARVAAEIRHMYPALANIAFWQPDDTFHLNVAILDRLHRGSSGDYASLLSQAAPAFQWLEGCPPYIVDFRGILITQDGTILATGYPRCSTPWEIRHRFIGHGFRDQQSMFHITVARILEPMEARMWRGLHDAIARRFRSADLGELHVRDAILIAEHEGFLHSPDCYRLIRHFHFERRPITREGGDHSHRVRKPRRET